MKNQVKIVIIGNGFGGIYTLQNLHRLFHKNPHIDITLIGEKNYFLFTPLLHEVATGGINAENIIQPIRTILRCCLKNFYLGKAEHINPIEKTVTVHGYTLPYDYLVLAPGAETNFYNIPGAEVHSFTLKSVEDARKIKNHVINQMECAIHTKNESEQKKKLTFTVIGGGPTGVELATELQELIQENFSHFYKKNIIHNTSVVLIQRDKDLVPQFSKKMRSKSLEILQKEGITVLLNAEVKEVGKEYVRLADQTTIETQTVIWVAGIKPVMLQFDTEIEHSKMGQLYVNEYLQLKEHPEIFALGDTIAFEENLQKFAPALAQAAEKEAHVVAENIQALIKHKSLKPFTYRSSGTLMSLGQWKAIGEVFNITFSGNIAWWIWRTIYLSKLISLRKKVEVAIDWTINLFSPRDISQF